MPPSASSPLSKGVAIAVLVVVVLLVIVFGWKTMKGNTVSEEPVKVDISKVKESLKTGKFGGH